MVSMKGAFDRPFSGIRGGGKGRGDRAGEGCFSLGSNLVAD